MIHSLSAWSLTGEATASESENDLDSNIPPAFVQGTPRKTVWDFITEHASSVNSQGSFAQHGSSPKWSSYSNTDWEPERKAKERLNDPARTFLEMQSAIQALSNTHNELLYRISQNEPWLYRNWLLVSYSYHKMYFVKADKRLYSFLARLSNIKFEEWGPQNDYHNDEALPEEIQTYLQNMRDRARGRKVRASPKPYALFKKEDWIAWRERLELIRKEVRESKLKYEFEKHVLVLLDKIDAFQEDFSNQYFRADVTWMYRYEVYCGNWVFQKTVKYAKTVASTLRKSSKTITNTLTKVKQNIVHEWNILVTSISEYDFSTPLDDVEQYAMDAKELLDEFSVELGEAFTDPKDQVQFVRLVLGVVVMYILATFVTTNFPIWADAVRRQNVHREERRRTIIEDTIVFSEDEKNSVLADRMPREHTTEINHGSFAPDPPTTGAKEALHDAEHFIPSTRENFCRRSNESAISCKKTRTKRKDVASINTEGPMPRSKATDSLRFGGRRINMVYNTDNMTDDSGAEIVAIVASAKENDVKKSRKPLSKHLNQSENGKGLENSDNMRANATLRKTKRILEDSKRILKDGSNTSYGSEDTRVSRSIPSTPSSESSDALANRNAKGKSSIPRRRSARLSAANMNRNAD
ncbi:unnamed protein product [Agarophyton chilense]